VLVGNNIDHIRKEYNIAILRQKKPIRPELWDSKTAKRCLQEILKRSLAINPIL
jgi:UDP-N-acetylglucosamine 2-epimerase (non-hydrolysing)